MSGRAGSPWPERDAELRALWADPANSAARIGGIMGLSKNAVVGRAHRLKLPGRPSPIRSEDYTRAGGRAAAQLSPEAETRLREMRAAGRTAKQIADALGLPLERARWLIRRFGLPAAVAPARPVASLARSPKAVLPPPPPRAVPAMPVIGAGAPPAGRSASPHRTCQWIHGSAKGAATRFCDVPVRQGSSYCAEHHALCARPAELKAAAA